MAKCGYCGSTIIMGGVRGRGQNQRFCNNKCQQGAHVLSVTKSVAPDFLEREIERIWGGVCPKCRGRGPVDVHKIHAVWSALVVTRWTTKAEVSCRSCAVKQQLGGAVFSFFFGWWGVPWGIILTPVQISRNLIGASLGPNSSRASESLRKVVLVTIGAQILAREKADKTPPPVAKPSEIPPPARS